jgi:hypothetical protein
MNNHSPHLYIISHVRDVKFYPKPLFRVLHGFYSIIPPSGVLRANLCVSTPYPLLQWSYSGLSHQVRLPAG